MKKVQYEEMLPHEFGQALEQFPVAYVPVGSLEWHSFHLPYGNDALKVHGLLLRAAQQFGGIVVPPTYWGHMQNWRLGCHPGLPPHLVDELYTAIFQGLVSVGFKVVIGVTGHNVKPQVASLRKAADTITAHGRTIGFAMSEGDLYDLPGDEMDHAGHWETSILMALRSELVEMHRIRDVVLSNRAGQDEAGIWGRDPRTGASRELGEKIINRIVNNIGKKAHELLAALTQ